MTQPRWQPGPVVPETDGARGLTTSSARVSDQYAEPQPARGRDLDLVVGERQRNRPQLGIGVVGIDPYAQTVVLTNGNQRVVDVQLCLEVDPDPGAAHVADAHPHLGGAHEDGGDQSLERQIESRVLKLGDADPTRSVRTRVEKGVPARVRVAGG